MNKQETLATIKAALADGTITEQDLAQLRTGEPQKRHLNLRVATILYYIGGLVIFLGIAFFIAQQWEKMGSALRILVTLGFGLGFSVASTLIAERNQWLSVSDAFSFIGGLLIPSGVFVTLYELGYRDGRWGSGLIFLSLTVLWWLQYRYRTRIILLVFSIVYGTIAYVLLVNASLLDFPLSSDFDLQKYSFLALGISYLFLGLAFVRTQAQTLTAPLYFFSAPIILGMTMYLQGYAPDQSVFWELIYPIILFAGLFASVYLKSRSYLVFSSLFVVGYVIKIMEEYFRDALSGPIVFIIAGGAIMAMGYVSLRVNRQYFNNKSVGATEVA